MWQVTEGRKYLLPLGAVVLPPGQWERIAAVLRTLLEYETDTSAEFEYVISFMRETLTPLDIEAVQE
jgi:hypothetical protein